jgi:hypothetical protein
MSEIENENLEGFNILQKTAEMEKEIDDFFDIYLNNEQFKETCSIKLEF